MIPIHKNPRGPGWPACLLATALALGGVGTIAAQQPYVMPNVDVHELPQSSNGQIYKLLVGLPLGYANTTRSYPTVYVTDPHLDFELMVKITDYLRRDGHAPEAIVIGIGYGGESPDTGALRQWDLTPGIDPEYDSTGQVTGHAEEFLTVIAEEIIPFVEANYRVDTAYRVIAGASIGGLFAVYAAFERPGLFEGAIASSPSLSWGREVVLSMAQEHAASGQPLNCRIYIGYASGDSARIIDSSRNFARTVSALNIPNLRLAIREVEGGAHNGTKPENFTRGMRFAFLPRAWVDPVGVDPGYGTFGRMVNLSTRARVDVGENVVIGGLVVNGIMPKRVLLRAIGPSLEEQGVQEPLANPRFQVIRMVNEQQEIVAENDDWGTNTDLAALNAAMTESGAFALPSDSLDAAMIVTLEPGQYTVIVESADDTSGIALVESYELSP